MREGYKNGVGHVGGALWWVMWVKHNGRVCGWRMRVFEWNMRVKYVDEPLGEGYKG
ncbi:hypothetical protein DPMN_134310 [Dreissena polymorpha]|uniref:Uncharacterized protein n=1 Tax=Dreissena polymorpha TaxID=45954 RepID=A0A9D4JBS9_DREPO|nr:hypothetical protein DPMN_134310 [Dreissena polymorpha]